jgi:beta-lactamase class A
VVALAAVFAVGCASPQLRMKRFTIDYTSRADPALQAGVEKIDSDLRAEFGMAAEQTAVGVFDLKTGRLAMIQPDRIEYAASVAKVGILLAYFELHPEAATSLDPQTKHELGLMIKASSNEMAAKFSEQMGLHQIQDVLNRHGFYDAAHGGGIWVGKHYGKGGERIGDPVGNNSHGATVRQLLRFYLMIEQDELISPAACEQMREIFASPDIRHDQHKFVKGLAGCGVTILRKWGSWEDWLHDSAIIEGPHRKYIVVALTHHPRGDEYLERLAQRVDDLLQAH